MATPSSSATSPSPPMPYLHHGPPSQQATLSSEPDSVEEERRKKAIQRFLARAEIAMMTRSLRSRLSYASYKATNNVPHVSIRDLEAQSQSHTASFNRTIAAKRKAVGAPTYYHSPATQGSSTSGAGSHRKGASGSMAPPASITSPRLAQPMVAGTSSHPSFHESTFSVRNHPPSLYSSILAPPPSKQARTIHNVHDPPLPAPSRPQPSPKSRVLKTSPRTETPRTQAKGKHAAKSHKAPTSPDRQRTQGGSIDKGKRKQDTSAEEDADVDMKAAAALTSLLMHHRPSIAGSASCPRSSIDGSEVGSVYSYSHFAQSSARTSAANVPTPLSAAPSSSNVLTEPGNRTQTPPPSGHTQQQTTPRAAPTDSEAANLMLFLATSPSPARPANKDAKDMAAYRALGGGTGLLRSKGRVLFPSSAAPDPGSSGQENNATLPGGIPYRPPPLTRGGDTSFTSSVSNLGDLGASAGPSAGRASDGHRPQSQGSDPSVSSSGPIAQLLPPAPLPLPSAPSSPSGRMDPTVNPRPHPAGASSGNNSTLDFNFHEFINASPSSPSRTAHGLGTAGNHKSNHGLRADVGRKLFEEEQMRHAHALQGATGAAGGGPGQRQEDRTLGAGIDLVHT